ncbi:MAG: hypothetical protein IE933_14315 [Sphingomonadales bacterium]|nr:hypothetical protein [Sphingomonadales bacterium]MBD3775227.1 hypothetical protein [Paracoccaceae bacterium]
MRKIFLALALTAALAACGKQPDTKVTDEAEATATPTDAASDGLPPDYLSTDCKVVMAAYAGFLRERDYRHAAMAWSDETVDSDALALRFEDYGSPDLTIGETSEEGAAGSLYCNATVTLRDADQLQKPLRQGTVTLKRVNDVPGATPDQLRWRIESSTLAEAEAAATDAASDGAKADAKAKKGA